MQQVAPASSRPVCNEAQQQITSVCVTSFRTPSLGSGCTQSALGGSGPLCVPTNSHLEQSGSEVAGLPVQKNCFDCSSVTQHALILGSSGHVGPNPSACPIC